MRHWIPVVLLVLMGSLVVVGGASADWPMFQGTLEKSGHFNGTLPRDNTTMWTAEAELFNYNTPTIANGVAYFSGYDYHVRAVDVRNGEELWATPLDWITVQSSAAIDLDNDQLYIANLNSLYALDLTTGEIVWKYRNQWGFAESGFSWIEVGSPAYYNDHVYYGSFDGYLYKFPAIEPDGDGVMEFDDAEWAYLSGDIVPDSQGVFYTPVTVCVEEGIVLGATVVEGGTNPGELYAVNDNTGNLAWSYEFSTLTTPGINVSIPGSGSHSASGPSYDVDAGANGIVWCPNGDRLYAVDLSDGDELYVKTANDWIWGQTPSWNESYVFVGDYSGALMAYDKVSGHMEWEIDLGGSILTSLVFDNDGYMYTAWNDWWAGVGVVVCLHPNGSVAWEYNTTGLALSSFAVDDGVLFISVADVNAPWDQQYLYAFGDKPMEVDLQVRTVMSVDAVEGTPSPILAKVYNDGTMSAYDVKVDFYYGDPDGSGEFLDTAIAPRLKPGEDTPVVLEWAFDMSGDRDIYAVVDPDDDVDETREGNNVGSGTITILSGSEAPVTTINSITPGDVYQIGSVTIDFAGEADDDGTIEEYIWRSSIDGTIGSDATFGISVHDLSVGAHLISFSAVDDDGLESAPATAMLFIRPDVGDPWPEWMHDNNNTATSSSDAVQLPTREWKVQANSWTLGSPVVVDGVIYYASWDGVSAADFETGETIWYNDTNSFQWSTPAVSTEHGIVVTVGNNITGWYIGNGTAAWNIPNNGFWEYTSPTIAGDVVYVAERVNCILYALNLTTGVEVWSTDFADNYILGSPSVGFDHVFIVAPNFDNEESFLAVYGLDIDDGGMDWRWKLNPGQIGGIGVPFMSSGDGYSSPVLFEDGSGNGYVVVTDLGGSIYALDPDGEDPRGLPDDDGTGLLGNDDGEVIWQWDEPDGYAAVSSPSYHDGRLYFATIKGEVYSLDAFDGTTEYWSYDTEFFIWSSPVVAEDGIVYVASWDSYLYAFDLTGNGDGTTDLLWRAMTLPLTFHYSHPVLYNGSLVMLGPMIPNDSGTAIWSYSPFVDAPELEISTSMFVAPNKIALNETARFLVGIANRGVADSMARVDVYINETDDDHRVAYYEAFVPAGNVTGLEVHWNTTGMPLDHDLIVVVSDPLDPDTSNNMIEADVYVKPTARPRARIDLIYPNPVERNSSIEVTFTGSVKSKYTITDLLWNISGSFLSNEEEFTIQADDYAVGTYDITFTAKDEFGLWSFEDTEVYEVFPPGTQPVARIIDISPNPADVNDTVSFEGEGSSDSGKEIVRYRWWWTGGTLSTQPSFSEDAETFGTGKWWIYFEVEDEDGLEATTREELRVVSDDPPTVIIDAPIDGAEVSGVVNVTGTADSNEDIIQVEVAYSEVGEDPDWENDGLDVEGLETWYAHWDTDGLSGEMEVHARAKSESGLESEVEMITVTVMSSLPTVEITNPSAGDLSGSEITITGTATDESAVDKVEVKFNSGSWNMATDDSGDGSWSDWSYEWNFSSYDDGETVNIRARATDDDGDQRTDTVEVTIRKPNIGPEIDIVYPDDESGVLSGFITVEGSAEDTDGEISRVQISVGDPDFTDPIEEVVGGEDYYYWEIELDTNPFDPDYYWLYARAQDNDGHFSNNASVYIRIDNRVPTAIIKSVKPGVAVWNEDTIIMKGEAVMEGDYVEERDIAEWEWSTNRGSVLGTNATIVVKAEELSVGVHEIELRVKGANGKWSDENGDRETTQLNVKKGKSSDESDDEWWEIPGMEATAVMTALAATILLLRKRR